MVKCKIIECDNKKIARGLCHNHYKRWQVHGDPLFTLRPRDRICTVNGCNKKHSSLGLCSTHERQFRRYGRTHRITKCFSSLEEAFLSQVIINENRCWDWNGSKTTFGYGVVCAKGRRVDAHRFSYEYYNNLIRDGLQVLHICDNPICTNPNHLFLGTQKDNAHDCINKKRFKKINNLSKAKGEKVASSKLTEKDVIKIKEMIYRGVSNKEIAQKFNVTDKNISCIKLGKTWKHIKTKKEFEL